MGPILERIVGSDIRSLAQAVNLLRQGGTVTSEIDLTVAHRVTECVSTREEIESIEAALPAALGRAQAALQACRVRCHRDSGDQPNLAGSLNELANMLSQLGRHREALGPAEESVKLRRHLVNPEAHAPELAASLSNLAITMAKLGRHREALAPAEESVKQPVNFEEPH